ncbi:YesL family protein [Evansella cellulosilytica]|uniref:DUF624 domain-containing protein n=1 Tax=Evansella cellulosilytica (strain ATCC 21833 / DSM 2522 / FERM P-1141 / JCM 9156 / N-4) TaxID=649639 RepID=E6TTI0_EVAC2|nr:DUF624 domain-containing protein [Evansella cellulosilytica]ADU29616.1 protein of unknown function DUF624 [Evansella cellulosilytica DSM 2522]
MQKSGFFGGLYVVCEWFMKLAYLNVLWILFSLLGLIVLGVAPATTAMNTIIRQWFLGNDSIPIFKSFWITYKAEFLRSNLFFVALTVIGFILYIDFIFLSTLQGTWYMLFMTAFILFTFLYAVLLLFLLPVYVHYELEKGHEYFTQAIMIGLVNPIAIIGMVTSIVILILLFAFIPASLLFFAASGFGIVTMGFSYITFKKIEEKVDINTTENEVKA